MSKLLKPFSCLLRPFSCLLRALALIVLVALATHRHLKKVEQWLVSTNERYISLLQAAVSNVKVQQLHKGSK